MARLFNDASNEYLTYGSPVVTTPPFAMFIWYKSNDGTVDQQLLNITDIGGGTNDFYNLELDSNGSIPQRARAGSRTSTYWKAESTINWTANVWQCLIGLFVTNTDRRVLLNGANKGTDVNDDSGPTGLDVTEIGTLMIGASRIKYFSGLLAEAAIWDLSAWPGANDGERADNFEKIIPSLAAGYSPLFFPLGLVSYWPLIRGLNDRISGNNMTVGAGTAVSAHPRIIYPSKIWTPSGAAAAPPTGIQTYMHHYQQAS